MFRPLIKTNESYAATVLRIVLGLILLPHGAQKMLGWFGGYGFSGTMDFFTGSGIPWIIGLLVILIEFFGALFLLSGFMVRLAAVGIIVDMIGIIFKSHIQNGFFMNWFGNQKGEGYEYHLLVIGMALSLLLSGAGSFSADKKIQDTQNR